MQNFTEYLQQANATNLTIQNNREAVEIFFYVSGLAAAGYLCWGAPDISFWLCVLLYVVYAGVVDSILKSVYRRVDARRFAQDPFSAQVSDQLAALDDFRQKHTLDERVHPAIAPRLEACATHRKAIVAGVRSEQWTKRNPGTELARVGEDAIRAADSAMSQALVACIGGYRPKGMPRKVWQAKVDADPVAQSHAEKLSAIERELAELADALGVQTQHATSIAGVLESLAEIRRAEQELDQTLQH